MSTYTFSYTDKTFLNDLVAQFPKGDYLLSISLHPDVPEAFVRDSLVPYEEFRPDPSLSSDERQFQRRQHEQAQARRIGLARSARLEAYGIVPHWQLQFDHKYGGGNPRLEYIGPSNDCIRDNDETVFEAARRPSLFSGKRFFEMVRIQQAPSRLIDDIKAGVAGFVRDGYIVTSIDADISPSVEYGEYWDTFKYAGAFWADNGTVGFCSDTASDGRSSRPSSFGLPVSFDARAVLQLPRNG